MAPALRVVGVLLVALMAFGVGAGVALRPLFVVPVIAVLFVVAAAEYCDGWWPFVPLVSIVFSPFVFGDGVRPPPNGDAAQKVVLALALLCLLLAFGLRWSAITISAVLIVGFVATVSIFRIGGHIEVGAGNVGRAVLGYVLPWCFFLVDWRSADRRRVLTVLAALPLLSVVVGVPFQLAGISTLLYSEYSGVPRLQGASIPAHLAMLALIGLVAALCLVVMPGPPARRSAYLLALADLGILLATATRGPIAVGVLLVATFLIRVVVANRSHSAAVRRSALAIAAVGVAVAIVIVPELIRRSAGNAYEGSFNTSGREQAWSFFYGLAVQSPMTGKGLGFAPLAVELYLPKDVQDVFLAPHNEYIHLLLDGGIGFAIGMGLTMVAAFVAACRCADPAVRYLIVVLGLGMLIYSYVDNTFSTPQLTVPLAILLGVLAVGSSAASGPAEAREPRGPAVVPDGPPTIRR